MLKINLAFDDFLKQIQQIKKMGNVKEPHEYDSGHGQSHERHGHRR